MKNLPLEALGARVSLFTLEVTRQNHLNYRGVEAGPQTAEKERIEANLTPMMRQWFELKARAGDALLFFRLGDFYELFEEDAIKAAPILGVTLTARNNRGNNTASSPLCGVPIASVETYLSRALNKGLKIALAEQTEEPKPGKIIVRRDIVQWFTPGIRFLKNEDQPHYAAVVSKSAQGWSLAAADVATGHVILESGTSLENLQELVERLPIEDLRSPDSDFAEIRATYREKINLLFNQDAEIEIQNALQLASAQDIELDNKLEVQVLGTLFRVLRDAHPTDRLRFLKPRSTPATVWMTSATRKNLYLFEPEDRSLFKFLDKTLTAPGRRELKDLLLNPTQDLNILSSRQKLIAYFKENGSLRQLFRSRLSGIYDLHRLLRRRPQPDVLLQITQSISRGIASARTIGGKESLLASFIQKSEELQPLADELEKSLQVSEDGEWGWIRDGVNATLDELRKLKQNSQKLLSDLEQKLREETGVNSLKIKFHQVFGYVAEVTASHKDKIPSSAKRIQTLANAERFKNEEINLLEEKILSLDSRLREAERSELQRFYELVKQCEAPLLDWIYLLGQLDAFQSLAEISAQHEWSTPETLPTQTLQIKDGIHPLALGHFVPLSFELNHDRDQVFLLTGPNMSGKSTVLRISALIAWLHQIGSDVPAKQAKLGIFDRIVCRMGASDDLTSGQSTFFLEMREVSSMLAGATSKSLLLFDEIGRGTSTFDGMSLAWSITEHIHELGALSFMATHYLELSELEKTLSRLRSYHLGVQEIDGQLVFTRRLVSGPASRSYGIQVAKLAQVSESILVRASQKLNEFEKRRSKSVPLSELFTLQ